MPLNGLCADVLLRNCLLTHSSAVGIVQLVAHEAGESILCREGGDVLFPDNFGRTCYHIIIILLNRICSVHARKRFKEQVR